MDTKRDPFFLGNKKKKEGGKSKDQKKNGDSKKEWKQTKFDKNRPGLQQDKSNKDKVEKEKKPFDKKLYRLKKYSNKYKLDQWEEQRKKRLLKNYYKEVENDPMVGTYKPVNFEDETDGQATGKYVRHPDLVEKEEAPIQNGTQAKRDPFQKAKERFNKIKQEKEDKKMEIEKAKEEKKQKLLEYKKKKQERFKKLSKKTKKGQPVMTGRLELLLEKIQKT